ncbi:MAG: DUF1727 domain-containing protein [Clostridia bacterium]|nr:DUF1727 domain-containing protein [Clostridia bacterium]
MKIRVAAAVFAAKMATWACRLTGSRASSLPGKVALRICPAFLSEMAKRVRGKIIVTCGTNGKTTTNNLMYTCITRAGKTCVCNNVGANMLTGIAAAYVRAATLFGKLTADCACFEIDEAYLRHAFRQFTPDVIVVTNLFRDQLDRYGEVDATAKLLCEAFALAPEAMLVLNADDPLTSTFGQGRKAIYYGIAEELNVRRCVESHDGNACALCGAPLTYDYYCYDKIGSYHCKQCGYTNPQAQVLASDVCLSEGILRFCINNGMEIKTPITGIYNIYNIMMAAAAMRYVGVPDVVCAEVFNAQKPEPGRMSKFVFEDKTAYLILSKNPAGFNQSVMTVLNDERQKGILLAVNDAAGDGEDVSWIWDVDFESLLQCNVDRFVLSGTRCYDVYLRLQYAGADMSKIVVEPDVTEAVNAFCALPASLGYALVNYTAMYPAYLALEKRAA